MSFRASTALAVAMTFAVGVVGPIAVAPIAAGAVDGTEPITTVAGGNDHGAAANQLAYPHAVAVGDDGSIYVSDTSNERVQRIAPDGTITTVAGGNGTGDAADQLNAPAGIAVDSSGTLYVADSENNRVQRITADGVITTIAGGNGFGGDANQLYSPYGLALGADGSLYIADRLNHRVQVVTDGAATTLIGGNGAGSAMDELYFPQGIAVDQNGVVFVVDGANQRLQKVLPDGTVTTVVGGNGSGDAANQLATPSGVAVDSEGAAYIADADNNRVQRISADGVVTTVAGGAGFGGGADQLAIPFGVAVDADDSLYVVDSFNQRVQKLTAYDTIDPTITVTSPTSGQSIAFGEEASVVYSCADRGTTQLESCTATLNGEAILNGTSLDTTIDGPYSLVVWATDGAGNVVQTPVEFSIEPAPVPASAPKPQTEPKPEPQPVPVPEPAPVNDRKIVGAFVGASGSDGSVARLYMAVFNRQPDEAGLAYWSAFVAEGEVGIVELADYFIRSGEFADAYDSESDDAFVELMYQNVLVRSSDDAGAAYWTAVLADGVTRATVLGMFSESVEFQQLTATT